jgi:hypothetical protein
LLTCLTLLMPAFALVTAPPPSQADFTADDDAPLPHAPMEHIRSFGSRLEPRYIVGARSLDQ